MIIYLVLKCLEAYLFMTNYYGSESEALLLSSIYGKLTKIVKSLSRQKSL